MDGQCGALLTLAAGAAIDRTGGIHTPGPATAEVCRLLAVQGLDTLRTRRLQQRQRQGLHPPGPKQGQSPLLLGSSTGGKRPASQWATTRQMDPEGLCAGQYVRVWYAMG